MNAAGLLFFGGGELVDRLEERLDVHFSFHRILSMAWFLIVGFFIFLSLSIYFGVRFSREKKNGVKYPEIRKLISSVAPCIGFFIALCLAWYPEVWNCPSCKQVNLYEDNREYRDAEVLRQWCRKCKRDEPHPKLYISDKPFYSH